MLGVGNIDSCELVVLWANVQGAAYPDMAWTVRNLVDMATMNRVKPFEDGYQIVIRSERLRELYKRAIFEFTGVESLQYYNSVLCETSYTVPGFPRDVYLMGSVL